MTKLPAEAYAIIEGRHSDPFHYLGLHPEGDKSVVRAFLPDAANVEAIGEHGEAAKLDRASMMPACSPARCRTARGTTSYARASATTSSISKTPIAFRRS